MFTRVDVISTLYLKRPVGKFLLGAKEWSGRWWASCGLAAPFANHWCVNLWLVPGKTMPSHAEIHQFPPHPPPNVSHSQTEKQTAVVLSVNSVVPKFIMGLKKCTRAEACLSVPSFGFPAMSKIPILARNRNVWWILHFQCLVDFHIFCWLIQCP
jgi:hypothetical protein